MDSDVQQYAFQAEINQLLSLIINAFYQDRDVFLRELISNASDALDKMRYTNLQQAENVLQNDSYKITLFPGRKDKLVLVIQDSGVGMNHDDLIQNLGTIAHSGTKTFMEALAASQKLETGNLIGQFGVGFYSAFLVANEVQVFSRKYDNDETWCWSSTASGTFTIGKVTDEHALSEHGTRIVLTLKQGCEEYAEEVKLREIVKKHSDFCSFPIYLEVCREVEEQVQKEVQSTDESVQDPTTDGEVSDAKEDETEIETVKKEVIEFEQLNKLKPIWQRKPEEVTQDEYDTFYKGMTGDWDGPLSYKHFEVEGQMQFKGVLFIPKRPPFELFQQKKQETNVKLYVRKVFVSDKVEELVPDWLSFIKGIVDSDDLPLNVSRETLQQNRIIKVIGKNIVKKSIEMMVELSEAEDKEPWKAFYENYKKCIKLGVHSDSVNREKLLNLLLFNTTKSETSGESGITMFKLSEYCTRMREKQQHIYYLVAESYESVVNSPLLETFKKNNIEVILMVDPIDEYMMQQVHEFDGKKLVNIAKDGLELPEDVNIDESAFDKAVMEDLCKDIKNVLGDKVTKVQLSSRLDNSPCVLISDMYGWTANMERIMKAQALNEANIFGANSRKILEINPKHTIISQLVHYKTSKPKAYKDAIQLVYDTALISSGFVMSNPTNYADKIFRLINLGLSGDDDIDVDRQVVVDEQEVVHDTNESKFEEVD